MVPLPLFKLAALFVRHVSKYGANRIKSAAHDHPRFRSFAARYGQAIHQLNMRMSVALLRNVDAEIRAKELADAPAMKAKEPTEKDEALAAATGASGSNKTSPKGVGSDATKTTSQSPSPSPSSSSLLSSSSSSSSSSPSSSTSSGSSGHQTSKKKTSSSSSSSSTSSSSQQQSQSVWKRKFRPLPEQKAVSLFADVVGDAFILGVAGGLIVYEYWKALQKPDTNSERIRELQLRIEELRLRAEETHGREEEGRRKIEALEAALRGLTDPKTKKPLFPSLQQPAPTQQQEHPALTVPPAA